MRLVPSSDIVQSEGWNFKRVDLYSTDPGVGVGELSMTPRDSREPFQPQEFEMALGATWRQATTR